MENLPSFCERASAERLIVNSATLLRQEHNLFSAEHDLFNTVSVDELLLAADNVEVVAGENALNILNTHASWQVSTAPIMGGDKRLVTSQLIQHITRNMHSARLALIGVTQRDQVSERISVLLIPQLRRGRGQFSFTPVVDLKGEQMCKVRRWSGFADLSIL